MVENALDAKATRIGVEIQAGGRSLIRVTDDGFGMSRDDALLCLEAHATSKIQRADDLAAVLTMGFRGEALPSIASVSRLSLTTRERDSQEAEATQILINGGRIQEVRAAAGPAGTSLEVRQLFYNLPARRKFLRTDETERAHILHYLTLAALSHPEVGFTFTQDGRLMWQLPPLAADNPAADRVSRLRDRMKALSGAQTELLPVEFSAELEPLVSPHSEAPVHSGALRVWGLIGPPGASRSTRDDQHLFVNRRPVENRGLNFALLEGYHTALMKGRYPVACLFLEIDPAEVDVNIHPTKREIKFRQEQAVRRLVAQAVRQTLLQYHAGRETPAAPIAPSVPAPAPIPEGASAAPPELPLARAIEPPRQVDGPRPAANLAPDAPNRPISSWPTPPVAAPPTPPPATPARPTAELPLSPPVAAAPRPSSAPGAAAPLLQVPLRLIGVVGKLYVLLESDRGLVLMDQHAAHERILFEQMLRRLEQGSAPSQRLLLPETIELAPRDAQFLREQTATLARLGVGLSEFGERTFLLDALPPFVKVSDARRFALELVDELKAAGVEVNSLRLGEHVVAKTVCRHAVKANDPLTGPELENLVADLRQCAMPYTCPHGRPTLIELNYRELEKKFGRSQ